MNRMLILVKDSLFFRGIILGIKSPLRKLLQTCIDDLNVIVTLDLSR